MLNVVVLFWNCNRLITIQLAEPQVVEVQFCQSINKKENINGVFRNRYYFLAKTKTMLYSFYALSQFGRLVRWPVSMLGLVHFCAPNRPTSQASNFPIRQYANTPTSRMLYLFPLLLLLSTSAFSQWINFTEATDQWLSLGPDGEEKDIVTADFNRDGWTDIIVVRREEFSVQGGKEDLLLLNTGTTLEDRTADYAPEFLTNPTDSRDVFVGDLDNDDWPDVVIASTFEDQPVFYHNLGMDEDGNWLGFLDESEERFPLPLNVSPLQFCAVWAGDITGDGAPDIYFNNYGINANQGAAQDVLLINDGTGHFVDESEERLGILRQSAFGTSVEMHDMDNDGDQDILKISTLFAEPPWNENGLFLLFNDGTGHFSNWQKVPSQAPYMFSVADVNRDGLKDIYVVDDAQDYLNMGFEIEPDESITFLGQLINDPRIMFFGGNVKFGDLDNDGYLDLGVADVDVDIPPCESGASLRKFTMMQNNGIGLSAPYGANYYPWNESTYDFAFIDLNNDCNLDVFLGRCQSYHVFMNSGNQDMGRLTVTGETRFCENEESMLDAGDGYMTYMWPDSSTERTLVVDTSGTYCVTVTDVNGCQRVDCIEVEAVDYFETSFEATICNGESYELAGQTFDQAGEYQVNLTSTGGCDSTLFLNLSVLDQTEAALTETICEGETYIIGSTSYTQTGSYTQTLLAENGCDSTVQLELTVIPNVISDHVEVATICQGEVYQFAGMSFVNAGTYEIPFPAANGCDSLVILELAVNPEDFTLLTETICEGESYALAGEVYTDSGVYQATFDNQYGCDSLVQVNLIVRSAAETQIFSEICEGESIVLDTMTFDQPGDYEFTLLDQYGCDSTILLSIAQLPSAETMLTATICQGESYTVGASTYTESGSYEDLLFTTDGCDSTVFLDLTVIPTQVVNLADTLCSGGTVIIGDQVFSETGMYEVGLIAVETGCDSVVMLDLTVGAPMMISDTTILADNGTGSGSISVVLDGGLEDYSYQWSNDSTTADITGLSAGDYTLSVTDGAGCTAIFTFTVELNSATGATSYGGVTVRAFPNPFSESVTIQLDNGPTGEKLVEVIDVNGRRILSKVFALDQMELSWEAPAGVYWYRVWQEDEVIGSGRVVKQ